MSRIQLLGLVGALAVGGGIGGVGTYYVVESSGELVIPPTPAEMQDFYGDNDTISICSFNIQFLGNFNKRDDPALGAILAGFDIVVVQELVSPPYEGEFPNGDEFKPDAQSAEFFDVMTALGFEYELSVEDTGTGDTIHKNGSSTEWWVVFYKPDRGHNERTFEMTRLLVSREVLECQCV